MAIAEFRLFDRSLSPSEISALFADPASECCIGAGLKDAYGVHDLDLSMEAMRSGQPSAVAMAPSAQRAGNDAGSKYTTLPNAVRGTALDRPLRHAVARTRGVHFDPLMRRRALQRKPSTQKDG